MSAATTRLPGAVADALGARLVGYGVVSGPSRGSSSAPRCAAPVSPRRATRVCVAALTTAAGLAAVAEAADAQPAPPPQPATATPAPAAPTPAPAVPTPAPAQPAPATDQPGPTSPAAAPTSPLAPNPTVKAEDVHKLFGLRRKPAEETGCAAADAAPSDCALEQDPLAPTSPLTTSTWLSAVALRRLPVGDALHDSQAAFALGVGRDDGGVFIAGASSYETRWTLEGMPIDSPRTGAADTRVPLAFLSGLRVTTGGFSARDAVGSGGVIDAELVRGGAAHRARAQAWLGAQGPRKDRPVLQGSYSPLRGRLSEPRTATVTAVADGPLGYALGRRWWYAAGAAPTLSLSDLELTGARLIDRDNDGEADRRADGGFATEIISRSSLDATSGSVPLLARAGASSKRDELTLTLLTTYSDSPRFAVVATPEAAKVDRLGLAVDGVAAWRHRWRASELRARLGWHRNARREQAAVERAGELPQLQTAYVPAAEELAGMDPRFGAACADGTDSDHYLSIANCPVPTGWFVRQGVGVLTDVVTDRPSIAIDGTHLVGNHALRAGLSGEDARLVVRTRYSGGALLRSLFPEHSDRTELIDASAPQLDDCKLDIDVPCPTVDELELTYRTRHVGLYLEDTWRPRADLLLDFGVRWEYQQLGNALRFERNLAPRAGAAWDPLGKGRSRVAVSLGRMFAYLPAGLGETLENAPATVSDISSPFGRARVINFADLIGVTSELRPMITDELTLSAELVWPALGQLRLRSQHRWLRKGLEDTMDGLDNPPAASRRVDVIGLELANDRRAALGVRAGYSWGQALGSLVGAYDPRRGAILYTSSDFDEVVSNVTGELPTSLGHRFYAELASARRVGPAALEAGARLAYASGRPRSVIAESELVGPIYLLPRGSAGRLPSSLTTDLRVAASWSRYTLTLQVQNVFSRQVVTSDDEVLTRDTVLPIDGGDSSDLLFLKDGLGNTPARSSSYRTPTSYQAPIYGFLGIEASL